jgi:Subtilase family
MSDPARAAGRARQRQHEIRIAVRFQESVDLPDPATVRPSDASDAQQEGVLKELATAVDGVLPGWSLHRWGDGDVWVVAAPSDDPAGTATYAARAHDAVQQLLETGIFRAVEADLPVTAYASLRAGGEEDESGGPDDDGQGAFGNDPHLPGSERSSWARDAIRCTQAWAVPVPQGGAARGRGVLVGHPDTGYTLHPGLGREALDLRKDRDVIDGDDNARDPMVPPDESPWAVPSPGHGTKTASVIVGRGTETDGVVGVAPEAVVVPIRAVESVVQLFDSDVARAVDHARVAGCDVVSMSLGGKGFFGLREAIQRAVDSGMIVMAAAGNKVGIVVAPASYDNCLAVAASGIGDLPWPGTSRGGAVDVTAPGWSVHVATFRWNTSPPTNVVDRSSGTSYAVAHLAGVAALWLAHHGRDVVRARYGKKNVQAAFLTALRGGGHRRPRGWDVTQLGMGIVDAEALLRAPLPDPADVLVQGAFGAGTDPADRLAALVDVDRSRLELGLGVRLRAQGADLAGLIARHEGELAYLLLEDPAFRESVLSGGASGAFGPDTTTPAAASAQLSARLA